MLATVINFNKLNLSDLSPNSLEVIIWGTCIGIILATLLSIFYKSLTAPFIKALIKSEALNPEKAKSLKDLCFKGKPYIKNQLTYPNSTMRKYVIPVVDGEIVTERKKIDAEKARFYLSEEKKTEAELRFTPAKHPIFSLIFTAVLVVCAAVFALYAAPELIQMLNNFISTL